MKNTVIVKKCKSHRVGICVTSAFAMAVITVLVFLLHTAAALMLYMPILVIVLPLTLDYTTWQMHFSKSKIEKKVFFRKAKSYSYAELREVVKGYYTSERNYCIRMRFADGKKLQFRLDDENAVKAEKHLLKHCSFKTIF